MSLWTLIRDCVRELESANNIKLNDSAWQRFKDLEQDIYALFQERDHESEPKTVGGQPVNFWGEPLRCIHPGCEGRAVVFFKQDVFTFGYCEEHAGARSTR